MTGERREPEITPRIVACSPCRQKPHSAPTIPVLRRQKTSNTPKASLPKPPPPNPHPKRCHLPHHPTPSNPPISPSAHQPSPSQSRGQHGLWHRHLEALHELQVHLAWPLPLPNRRTHPSRPSPTTPPAFYPGRHADQSCGGWERKRQTFPHPGGATELLVNTLGGPNFWKPRELRSKADSRLIPSRRMRRAWSCSTLPFSSKSCTEEESVALQSGATRESICHRLQPHGNAKSNATNAQGTQGANKTEAMEIERSQRKPNTSWRLQGFLQR